MVLVLALAAGILVAQPMDGDLIVTCWQQPMDGITVAVNPRTGAWSTLGASTGFLHNTVQMASDNRDLMVGLAELTTFTGGLARIKTGGTIQTLTRTPGGNGNELELDGDGDWLIAGGRPRNFWSLNGSTLTTLFQGSGSVFTAMCIDRDPGAPPYVIAAFDATGPHLYGADRNGITTTILSGGPATWLVGLELDPSTGDYIVVGRTDSAHRVSKSGLVLSTIVSLVPSVNALKMNQDGTFWCGGTSGSNVACYLCGADGTPLRSVIASGLSCTITGVEIFGSRSLVCSLPPASNQVTIRVQSRHMSVVPNQTRYVLAASFARRPGAPMPNGERINLNVVSDPLVYASLLNTMPEIFKDFQGVVGTSGNATATVDIPAPLRNSGVTVFVAGVLWNPGGPIFQVTNTHWFVL